MVTIGTAYRFKIVRADGSRESFDRHLPNDAAAVDWMGAEVLLPGDTLRGFRGDDSEPFASRVFGGDVQVAG